MSGIQYNEGPLLTAARQFPTSLWNDSSDVDELKQSISFGGVGATANPTIALNTISSHPDIWVPRIARIAEEHPTWGESQIGWQAVADMSIEAAKLLEPIFVEGTGQDGRLSIQTNPALHRDAQALADQAEQFSQLAPNIVVKVPATKNGIAAIEDATYRGVSMNVTVSFTVSQVLEAGAAIQRGLDRRKAEGLPTDNMGPVVTLMVGRLDDWMKDCVKRENIFLDYSALEWAGIAAAKKAYQIFQERGYQARVLIAAFRNVYQWAEFQGGDLVVSPPFKWQQIIQASDYVPVSRIDVPVAEHYIEQLRRIPDFNRAYDADGLTIDEFDTFGATRKTLRGFLADNAKLDALVRDVLIEIA